VGRERLDLKSSYNRVAADYAERIAGELKHKPFDRELLDHFAALTLGRGVVCDLGCGPGHVGQYLLERGVDVMGIDLSPGMLEEARRLSPGIDFREGDMRAIPGDDGSWAGIVCFYAIIHLPPEDVAKALREMSRVLQPDGLLLLAFHLGQGSVHNEDWWGHEVSVDAYFYELKEVQRQVAEAGLEAIEARERAPYPDVEYQGRRGYVMARKPGGALAAEAPG
jgi:SAM-dependent methyltransferase